MDISNFKEIIIAKDCIRTPNVQVWDPNAVTTYLGNGEVVITDAKGTVLSNTTAVKAVDRIFIKSRSHVGDGTMSSVELRGQDITGFYCEKYAAASEQKVELGYNGTIGNADINLVADTLYWFKLIPLFKRGERNPETFSWRSGFTTPTAADVLTGLSANLNIKADYDKLLRVTSYVETDSVSASIGVTGAVVKGSKFVTCSGAHSLVGGKLLVINSKVYVVEEVRSTTQFVLNQPYLDNSNAAIAIASVTDKSTGNWGLTIEGLPYEFEAGMYNYNKAKFEVIFPVSLFNTKPVITPADRGVGTYEQVRDIEWKLKGLKGEPVKTNLPYPIIRKLDTDAVATNETYDLVTITFKNNSTTNFDGYVIHEGAVVIAIPVGAGQGDGGTTTLEEVLNKYIVTEYQVPGATAIALT